MPRSLITRRGVALGLSAFASAPALAQAVRVADALDTSKVETLTRDAYRFLHETPELGKAELEASRYVANILAQLAGVDLIRLPSLPTAVIGVLDTGRRGATIALRAELDARKLDGGVTEPADHAPRSQRDGLMHNCGHDAHAAMLLGAASLIASQRKRFGGRIIFVFQPAEETAGGADDIVSSGILNELGVQAIFAQHCVPRLKVGRISLARGTPLAGSATFKVTLRGRESHAAIPYAGSDLTLVASRLIAELSLFPARHVDIANRPIVISVTQMSTNAQTLNALPSEIELRGTIRAFEDITAGSEGRPALLNILNERISALAAVDGAEALLTATRGSPPTRNDDALFDKAFPALQRMFGSDLSSQVSRGMFSEDFAFYTEHFPALYFSLGIAKDGLGEADTHSRDFTLHPDALPVGVRLLASIARDVAPLLT